MKQLLVSIIVICMSASMAYTQDEDDQMKKFAIFAFVASPTGDFASTSSFNAGSALTGFGIGFDYSHSITKSVNWITSASISLNGVDEGSIESKFEDFLEEDVAVDAGAWRSISLVSGLNVNKSVSSRIQLYALGQVGFLFGTISKATISSSSEKYKYGAASAAAFAYAVGGGLIINNKINLGLRYLNGEPQYKITESGGGATESSKYKQPTGIVQLTAGFMF